MENDRDDDRLAAAILIVREAGAMAMSYFEQAKEGTLKTSTKGVQDWLSEADQAVEEFLRQRLSDAFPEDGFFGEESGGDLGGQRTWVIDPIDGTANFVRGLEQWCISVAHYQKDAGVLIGIIYDPVRDRMFSARAGGGAFCNALPIQVSKVTELENSLIILGHAMSKPLELHLSVIRALRENKIDYRLFGSAALALTEVASGRVEGFHESQMNSYDVLAGLLLVQEAGGVYTPVPDDSFVAQGGDVTATNQGIAIWASSKELPSHFSMQS